MASTFKPEMFESCGCELEVSATADKTCDTANQIGGRSLCLRLPLEPP
jgi:hypothetical protein